MKELKEEILQAVNDATDLTDNIVSVPILSHFLDNILSDQLNLTDVGYPLCACGGNERIAMDCTRKRCEHPKYAKSST